MIESMMFMAIGFLLGGLAGLPFVSVIHNRAVRLTRRLLEPDLIQTNADIRLHKDFVRAEFAMAARRHEFAVEQLKLKMTRQLVELGRQKDTINRLKIEREGLRAEIASLKGALGAVPPAAAPVGKAADANVIALVRHLIPHRRYTERRATRQTSSRQSTSR